MGSEPAAKWINGVAHWRDQLKLEVPVMSLVICGPAALGVAVM